MARQQAADRAAYTQAFQQANTKSPLEVAREAEDQKWLDWSSGKSGPIDVRKAPLGPAQSLFDFARNRQENEKQGIGLLRMGVNASSPEYAANLASQQQAHREQDAAGQLERAVSLKDATVRGDVGALMDLQNSRNMGLAGMAGNQSGNSTSLWSQFRVRPGWGASLIDNLARGAGQAATMFV